MITGKASGMLEELDFFLFIVASQFSIKIFREEVGEKILELTFQNILLGKNKDSEVNKYAWLEAQLL